MPWGAVAWGVQAWICNSWWSQSLFFGSERNEWTFLKPWLPAPCAKLAVLFVASTGHYPGVFSVLSQDKKSPLCCRTSAEALFERLMSLMPHCLSLIFPQRLIFEDKGHASVQDLLQHPTDVPQAQQHTCGFDASTWFSLIFAQEVEFSAQHRGGCQAWVSQRAALITPQSGCCALTLPKGSILPLCWINLLPRGWVQTKLPLSPYTCLGGCQWENVLWNF